MKPIRVRPTGALRAVMAMAALAMGCASPGTTASLTAPRRPPAAPASDAERGVLPDSPSLARDLEALPALRDALAAAERLRLQVVLGIVEERPGGRPVLVQHGFRAGAEYLYPASSVKLFAAVAALERLAELRRETGLAIDARTRLVYHPLFAGEEREEADPGNLDGGTITVAHEIRKIFLVSDNAAFNHLYELVGPDRIAASVARAGLPGVRIVHRLSEPHTAAENRMLPRIDLAGDGFVHTLPQRTAEAQPPPPSLPGLLVGTASLDGDGKRIDGAMDFAAKNRVSLAVLQRALCMVVRPDVDCGGAGFTLTDADRELLRTAMSELPRESANPRLDPAEFPDAYVKFLLPGLSRVFAPERLRVYDKSGQAYGFTLDNGWIESGEGPSFFLAAALYTNEDGVLNDDQYDYETVALPVLADVAEAAARALESQAAP
jgi:beta-lactamase class A